MDEIERMNTPIEENYYPIHEACKTNNIIAVKHLLPHVNVNICSPIGTPIMIACKYNYPELIDLLIDRVNLSIKDARGNIFLHYLVKHPDPENRLPSFGDYMIQRNNKGVRPLDLLHLVPVDIISSLPPIFFFGGHGCDTGVEKIVPENCLYITFALCGNMQKISSIAPLFSMRTELLEDPIKYKREIEKHLKLPIQIYKPGDTYSDVVLIPPFDSKESKKVFSSGLQSVYLKERFTFLMEDDPNLKQLFQYSLYPEMEDVPDIESIKEIKKWKALRVLQSSLFDTFEGIYYNFSCRTPCNEESKSRVTLRRKKSMTRRIIEGNIKTIEQLREADKDTLNEWIEDPGILFHAQRDDVLELIPDKRTLVPSKFIGGRKRKTRKH